MHLSEDGYLLQKVVHKETLKRIIDVESLGLTEEYISEQAKLSRSGLDKNARFIDKRVRPNLDNEFEMDRHYISEMCGGYSLLPDDRDVFVYYNDIQCLSGTAGYMRMRDGYVYDRIVVWRS